MSGGSALDAIARLRAESPDGTIAGTTAHGVQVAIQHGIGPSVDELRRTIAEHAERAEEWEGMADGCDESIAAATAEGWPTCDLPTGHCGVDLAEARSIAMLYRCAFIGATITIETIERGIAGARMTDAMRRATAAEAGDHAIALAPRGDDR